ncbi:MAG: phosphoadenylyl-sulfate reductase, partial [Mesorhizobium sp.]
TDACCNLRKVEPLARGVEPFRAWFTGRKRFQASTRAALPVFEAVGSRIRINPLAHWTTSDQADYMRAHALRENPLVAYGYLSIGCFPCTQPVQPGEDARSGRWAGHAKTECGIHLSGLEKSLTDASL